MADENKKSLPVEHCEACRYYRMGRYHTGKQGTCRYGPPKLPEKPATASWIADDGVWPRVNNDDWCGEYEAAARA